jgi:hypothetical protein
MNLLGRHDSRSDPFKFSGGRSARVDRPLLSMGANGAMPCTTAEASSRLHFVIDDVVMVLQHPTNDFMYPRPWFASKGNGIFVLSKLEGQKRAKEWNAIVDE